MNHAVAIITSLLGPRWNGGMSAPAFPEHRGLRGMLIKYMGMPGKHGIMHRDERTILVVGATGRQGGAAARHLVANGWEVKAMTRDPTKQSALELRKLGAEIVEADLEEPDSLVRAMKGVHGVFAALTPFEKGAEGEIRQGKNLVNAAKVAGVGHLVYSSVGGAERRTGIPHFESKWQIENLLVRSRVPATILRPVFLMENFSTPARREAILSGRLETTLGPETTLQMVAVDDVGGFAAMAFEDPEHWFGRAIEIAGDEMTMPDVAESFSQAIGHHVTYVRERPETIRNPEVRAMYDWFQREGYRADIPKIREMRPGMKTFEMWLGSAGWTKEVGAARPADAPV
jgi:uncharacterized protein YbjT (DUF2867 family)